MFKNYLMTALRVIFRNKLSSFINILGLGLGLAFCILTYLYIQREYSYDRFHKDAEKIYQLYWQNDSENRSPFETRMPMALGSMLQEEFPEIESTVRIEGCVNADDFVRITNNDKTFFEDCLYADPSFFDVFSFQKKRPLLKIEQEFLEQPFF